MGCRWPTPSPAPRSSSPRTPCCASTTPPSTRVRWGGVVLDEAQFVKNRQAKTHVAVRRLGAPFTVAVTGTPLENSLMDLWSLLSLTAPGLYPRPERLHEELPQAHRVAASGPSCSTCCAAASGPSCCAAPRSRWRSTCRPSRSRSWPSSSHPRAPPHLRASTCSASGSGSSACSATSSRNRVAILALADPAAPARASTPSSSTRRYAGKATVGQDRVPASTQLRELAAEGHRALVFSQFTGFLRDRRAALDARGHRARLPRRVDPRPARPVVAASARATRRRSSSASRRAGSG